MSKNFFTKENNLSQFLLIYKLLRESLPSKINFPYSKLELSKRNTRGCIFKSKNLSEINWLLPRFKSRVTKEDVRLQIIAFSHTHINKYQKWKTLKAPLSPSSRIRIAKTRGKNREARMESKVIVGSRIKISRPRHRKRQNYYSINPYTRDLARTSGGLSRRSPRKLQQREKRGPAALFRELFFSFLARPPGTEPTRRAPWDLVAILLSRVRAPLDIPVHYISLQSLLSSSLLLLLLLSSFAFLFLFFLFPPRPGTERRPQEEEVGFKSYGIFLSTRRNLPRARFQLVIPKQTIAFADIFGRFFGPDVTLTPFAFPQSAFQWIFLTAWF